MSNAAAMGLVALAFAITGLPVHDERPPAVHNAYRIAEHFGCMEVLRTCKARKREERIVEKRK